MIAALVLACLVSQAPVQAQELVPDPEYRIPQPGDQIQVWTGDGKLGMGAANWFAYQEAAKLQRAGDGPGLDAMLKAGSIVTVQPGTRVRVLDVAHGADRIASAIEVRVQGGPLDGKSLHLPPSHLARMIPAAEAQAKRAKAQQESKEFEAKLDRDLAAGEAKLRAMEAGPQPENPQLNRPDRLAELDRVERYLKNEPRYAPNQNPAGGFGGGSGQLQIAERPRVPGSASQMLARAEELRESDPELATRYYQAIIKGYSRTGQASKARGRLKGMRQGQSR